MRLAFCLDGYHDQVGVELRQDERVVHAVMHGPGELDAIQRQVARVLSLDHDARGFIEVGQRDPVIGRLQRAAVGLRPPLFYSPYEAAVWSVLSARRPGWQMARVRAELSKAHGALFELAGERLAALPTPSQLLAVKGFPGIDADRLTRMHGAARAGRVVANVFVDAGLPVRNGHVPLAPPTFRDFLLQKTDAEGLLPGWTHWWDETDLEGLFPSAGFVSRSSESSRLCRCPTFRSHCRRRSAGMTDPARTSPSGTPTARNGTKLRPEGGRSLPCRASTCTPSSPQSKSRRPSTLCSGGSASTRKIEAR